VYKEFRDADTKQKDKGDNQKKEEKDQSIKMDKFGFHPDMEDTMRSKMEKYFKGDAEDFDLSEEVLVESSRFVYLTKKGLLSYF